MVENEQRSRWASEAFDFVRLSQRVSARVYGLILLELGWLLLVVLMTKLFPKGQPYIFEVPWITVNAGNNVAITLQPVQLMHVYIVGAFVVVAVWFYNSGLFMFITRPQMALLRGALPIVFYALTALLWLILAPFWLLACLIEISFFVVWKHRQTRETLVKWRNEKGGLYTHARKDMPFRADWVPQAEAAIMVRFLTYFVPFVSHVSIALANITTFSFDEELLAPKVPLQAFSEAWVRLHTQLRRRRATFNVSVAYLPLSLAISTPSKAQHIRSVLGYDAVLWGSYTTTSPPMLWINITSKTGSTSRSDTTTEIMPWQHHAGDVLRQRDLQYPAILVAQASSAEAYIAFLVAVRHASANKASRQLSIIPMWGEMRAAHISNFLSLLSGQ